MSIKNWSRWSLTVVVAASIVGSGAWFTASNRQSATAAGLPIPLIPFLPPQVPDVAPKLAPIRVPVVPSATPMNLKRSYQLIRVKLYAENPPSKISLSSAGGVLVLPGHKKMDGVITLSIDHDNIILKSTSKKIFTASRLKLSSIQNNLLEIRPAPGTPRQTRGELLLSVKKGRLQIVNVLDLDTYVLGTVEPELGSLSLPLEAIKAQIVASRSYILALGRRHEDKDFDFCDGPHCQVFAGVGHYSARFLKAATETKGVYLTYHGHPAAAFYHHSCGGQTAAIQDIWPGPAVPYLKRVQDGPTAHPYCSSGSRQQWSFTASASSLRACFAKQRWIRGNEALDSLRVIRINLSGRASQVLIQSSQPRWVTADQFRHVINQRYGKEVLLSTWFTVTRSGEGYVFRGSGWGHGVGMCQMGTIGMARQGISYQKILEHYFPGTQLSHLPAEKHGLPQKDPALLRLINRITDSLS